MKINRRHMLLSTYYFNWIDKLSFLFWIVIVIRNISLLNYTSDSPMHYHPYPHQYWLRTDHWFNRQCPVYFEIQPSAWLSDGMTSDVIACNANITCIRYKTMIFVLGKRRLSPTGYLSINFNKDHLDAYWTISSINKSQVDRIKLSVNV